MKRSSGAIRGPARRSQNADARLLVSELNQTAWDRLQRSLADLDAHEIDWRPLPESNNISVIVRHLRIEAQWHLDCLANGAKMPMDVPPAMQRELDAVPLDFPQNYAELTRLVTAFLDALRGMSSGRLRARSATAYAGSPRAAALPNLLGYHQALHMTGHAGQIQMIRNLFQKTRGRPARFFPENPSYPR